MFWLIFCTLSAWTLLVMRWWTYRRSEFRRRLSRATQPPIQRVAVPRRKPIRLFLRKRVNRVAQGWFRRLSGKAMSQVQNRLSQAGNPGNMNVLEWLGTRAIVFLFGLGLGLFSLSLIGTGLRGLFILLACLLLGWMGPDFWLSRRVSLRQRMLAKQLPSALDLLSVSVEAGLGFDQAMARVAAKMRSPLAQEWERTIREIQVGSRRGEALQRLSVRTGLDEVRSFVSAVIQADKLGIGMTQVLRIQSMEMRRKRKMDAQERAMKAPIKMLFPLVMFVFPALFLIILGPALLHIIQMFTHTGV